MKEFIDEFGRNNFIIIFSVIFIIVLALIIIVLLERHQAKKELKNKINREIDNCNRYENYETKEPSLGKSEEKLEEQESEIVYVENKPTKEEAKEKLEEVTRKLVQENSDLIDHTCFEEEQEEKSVISYEELLNISHDIDEKNDKLLEEEEEVAITLEELYQKHINEQDNEEESLPNKISNPIFDTDDKKFKNSEVISPVFGLYSGKVKQEANEEEFLEILDEEAKPKDIETEIEKTEEFLDELKRLKNKLD